MRTLLPGIRWALGPSRMAPTLLLAVLTVLSGLSALAALSILAGAAVPPVATNGFAADDGAVPDNRAIIACEEHRAAKGVATLAARIAGQTFSAVGAG